MFLSKIKLTQFKNHTSSEYNFSDRFIAFVGLNGTGKTNILDAIHYLSCGKSYFSSSDRHAVTFNKDFFRIEGVFLDKATEEEKVSVVYQIGKKKQIKVNDERVKKLSDYLGRFPCVVISPQDSVIITGNSEERRKYLDYTLSQTDKNYFDDLKSYNEVLGQRNALLKKDNGINTADLEVLDYYDSVLLKFGKAIYKARLKFLADIQPYVNESTRTLASKNELHSIKYVSVLSEDYKELLKTNREKDIILKRTTKGIHTDDLIILLNDEKLKLYGSQGQQKTFLLALKFAQLEYLNKALNKKVVLLLDDIFDKLDFERSQKMVKHLLEKINQVFITHTNKAIIEDSFGKKDKPLIFEL